MVGLNGLANIYKERGIFNNSLYGLVAGIVGAVMAAVVLVVAVLSTLADFLQKIYPSWNGNWSTISSISGMTPNFSNIAFSDIVPLLEGLLAVFLVLWVFVIVWAFFARRSLKMLATKSSVGLFSTAALLLLIGAVLTIILIGALLIWIAMLLMAIAFFQIKPQPEQPPLTVAPSPFTPTPV
jgi:uncharacterized membrane protein